MGEFFETKPEITTLKIHTQAYTKDTHTNTKALRNTPYI